MFNESWMPLIIFALRICDVTLGTLRVICVMRGQKFMAVVLGFFETLIWIYAVSGVFSHLNQLSNVVAYAAGFAAGNAVGMWIEAHLAWGTQAISFVSRGTATTVAEGLRLADYFVTEFSGYGKEGPVSICHAVIPRRQAQAAMRIARLIDSKVAITVEDIRECYSMVARPQLAGKFPIALGRRAVRLIGDFANKILIDKQESQSHYGSSGIVLQDTVR